MSLPQLIQSQDLHVTHVGQKKATNDMSSQHVATCGQQFLLRATLMLTHDMSRHVQKSLKSTKLQGKKEYFWKCFFCAMYSSCHKESKNAIKNEKCQYLFPGIIVWYTLHTKFSEKLVMQQMQMSVEIYNIWLTLRQVSNMLTTFPTKVFSICWLSRYDSGSSV